MRTCCIIERAAKRRLLPTRRSVFKLGQSGVQPLRQKCSPPQAWMVSLPALPLFVASSADDVAAHGANMAVDGSSNTFWVEQPAQQDMQASLTRCHLRHAAYYYLRSWGDLCKRQQSWATVQAQSLCLSMPILPALKIGSRHEVPMRLRGVLIGCCCLI